MDFTQKWRNAIIPPKPEKWDKDDLLTVVYWFRQFLGVALGVIWGLIPVTGLSGTLTFLGTSSLITFLYYSKYLKVDESIHGPGSLFSEGMLGSFALFLAHWILVYTFLTTE